MGACFGAYVYQTGNKDEVAKLYDEDHSRSQYESGSQYSGEVGSMPAGLEFPSTCVFENREVAEEYIWENHEKWEPAMAVRFHPTRKLPESVTRDIEKRRTLLGQRSRDAVLSANKAVRGGKSKLVTCKSCEAKLPRERLKPSWSAQLCANVIHCPVCSEHLLSKTAAERVRKATQALGVAMSASAGTEPDRSRYYYLVGGQAPS